MIIDFCVCRFVELCVRLSPCRIKRLPLSRLDGQYQETNYNIRVFTPSLCCRSTAANYRLSEHWTDTTDNLRPFSTTDANCVNLFPAENASASTHVEGGGGGRGEGGGGKKGGGEGEGGELEGKGERLKRNAEQPGLKVSPHHVRRMNKRWLPGEISRCFCEKQEINVPVHTAGSTPRLL